MKKLFSLSFLAIGVAGIASATTITTNCPTSGGSGASGSSTTTCLTAAGPVGASSLDSLTLTFKFDANFGLGSGSVQENFDALPSGSGDIFGGLFDHPTNQVITDVARPIIGSFVINNPSAAQVAASLGGLQIQSNWNTGAGSFNNAALDYQIDVVFTPRESAVPEPATFGLVGGVLTALGLLVRTKKERLAS